MYFVVGLVILVLFGGLGAFLVWFGWVFLVAARADAQIDQQIAQTGVNTDAEIVNHDWRSGRRSGSRYYITYRFAVKKPDGSTDNYTRETRIDSHSFHQLSIGDSVCVRYLPDQPKSSTIISGAKQIFTANVMRMNGYVGIGFGVVLASIGLVWGGVMMISDLTAGPRADAAATAVAIRESATPLSVHQTAAAVVAANTAVAATSTRTADDQLAAEIKDKLTPRLPDLRSAASAANGKMLRLLPPETGLGLDEFEIDYGTCGAETFYVYVWLKITDRMRISNEIDTFFDGYGYVEGSEPAKCYPKDLSQVWNRNGGALNDNWWAISGATEVKITS